MMENKQRYISVLIFNVSSEVRDKLNTLASEHNADGIEEYSLSESEVDEILGVDAFTSSGAKRESIARVEKYVGKKFDKVFKVFFYKHDYIERSKLFSQALDKISGLKYEVMHEDWEDWNSLWRKYFKPIEVSKELTIYPEWEKGQADKANDIVIYPGMGFGTGDHQTTFLCLKMLEEILIEEIRIKRVLDFGCGSGILGIAAIKKIKNVYCELCDIDRQALDNCVQNLLLNFSKEKLDGHKVVSRDRFACGEPFNLVFANILEPVLIEEFEVISNSLNSGGHLIVSGILNDQVDRILQCYETFNLKKQTIKDDWSCLWLIKKESF